MMDKKVEQQMREDMVQQAIQNTEIEGLTVDAEYRQKLDAWARGEIEMQDVQQFIKNAVAKATGNKTGNTIE